jgi:hypothetical protein
VGTRTKQKSVWEINNRGRKRSTTTTVDMTKESFKELEQLSVEVKQAEQPSMYKSMQSESKIDPDSSSFIKRYKTLIDEISSFKEVVKKEEDVKVKKNSLYIC